MNAPSANLKTLAWAVFLGCSWTWCIGMFLPLLLVRDLGLWGWLVFAVPNVLGAAAMGWMLSDPGLSERIVKVHAGACLAFSAVTIAFQVFFVLWFVPRLIGLPWAASTFAIVTIYLLITGSRAEWDVWAAAVTWAISVAMIALFLRTNGRPSVPIFGKEPTIGALWLMPVCVLGFGLCPYLDLTFHRARQQLTAAETLLAFGLGFGVCFLSMIVFSLLYATVLQPLLADRVAGVRFAVGAVIAIHMIVQSAFTLGVHARALFSTVLKPSALLGALIVAQFAVFIGLASHILPRYHGMDPGELIYRIMMAFYGLIFPAYVWLCMVPGRDGSSGATPTKARATVLAAAAAAPMYWMGFIEGRLIWLVPGLAVVLLTRYLIPSRRPIAVAER